ncbi:helix-turn-helix domain-containing protein [Thermus thermophilus]|uniref:helix-turn-helix domain-containing protein n=1 Tax=Thermus thermophilus TaxID=274 RepID=UPI0002D913BC|nr:helix-turn-helix domain-containing protein [Thermus thermophilus]
MERARWHAIWLLATGHSIPQVAQTLGYSTCWVRGTLPRHNEGQPPLLPPELWKAFRQALLQSHPQDGIWTIRNAAEWLSERLGRPVDSRRAWNWRKRLGFAPPPPPTPGRDVFVRPSTGESGFWLLPPVSAGQRSYLVAFSEVLRRFAQLRGAGEGKLLLSSWTGWGGTWRGGWRRRSFGRRRRPGVPTCRPSRAWLGAIPSFHRWPGGC